jgi:hypothetical protein
MRKALTATAAALAAVIFFLLLTLPPGPRAVSGAEAELARRTVAGAYHIHTTRSDGGGDRAAVAAAARRAGLQFVIITDHGDATRGPDLPAYIDDVLCIDGVEVSTNGGHYVALGLGAAPYPLGGEPESVIEDVTRLGGFGFAAHPDSARSELGWADWRLPFDGVEWLNADSEWRNEKRSRLPRLLFDYLVRPAPALASILDRPVSTLARWDALAARRQVLSIAGHDAHGGIGRSTEYRTGRQWSWAPGVPSYEAGFKSFSTRVVLEHPLTGGAEADAAAVLRAIRSGRMFTAVDAIAGPAVLEFHARRGESVARMGDILPPGPASLVVSVPVPAGASTVLLRNGEAVSTANAGVLRMDSAAAQGAYRVEVRLSGGPGRPPIPWILTNPIYFLEPGAPASASAPAGTVPLPAQVAWHVEKDRFSRGSVVASAAEVAFYYRLRGPGRGSQFVAAVADLQRRAPASASIRFSATADRPARVSVQLRYGRGGGQRWIRSVYLDSTPRDISVPVDQMRPADRQSGPPPPATAALSLLFVVDLTNAVPGAANTLRISRVGFAPGP